MNLLNMGGRRRRRRRDDGTESWKDIIYSAIETFQYGTQPSQPGNKDTVPNYVAHKESSEQEEDMRQTDNTAGRDTHTDSSADCLGSSEPPDPEDRRPLMQDLARTGPMLAMWLVDTGDGRVSGEEGRSRVCQTSRYFTDTHGWLGSIASHLLTSTLAAAISENQDSKELLDWAGLSAGTIGC
ncbi:uncharacterized protein LOC126995464 isoform X2 [Eriocheir sinensis]|nr:uncharacterized protein LOC126995464 isoform X2 [Eriocheir sinensis]XP_050710988.1 uncharacterized protein LOC126995464 isoform X2 [Eriocheir sinensis]